VLLTGRILGRITQKGPNKKCTGQTNVRPNFCWFCTERAKRVANSVTFDFLLLFSLILGKSKEYYYFFTYIYKKSLASKAKMPSKKEGKISKGPNFFLNGRIFPGNWPERPAKSWQRWSAERYWEFPIHLPLTYDYPQAKLIPPAITSEFHLSPQAKTIPQTRSTSVFYLSSS
jgi:hypothetical protein